MDTPTTEAGALLDYLDRLVPGHTDEHQDAISAVQREAAAPAEARLAAMTGLVQLLWGGLRAIVETSTDHRTIKQARIIVEEAKPLFARAFLAPAESPGSVSAGTGSVTPGDTAPLAAPSTPASPEPLDVEALVGAYRRAVVLWHGCDRHPGQALLDCPVGTCEEARDLLARAKEPKP